MTGTYIGTVSTTAGEPLGPLKVRLGPNGIATGSMRIGERPAQGLVGFSGTWTDDGFNAGGENNVQHDPADPFDDVNLAVDIEGALMGPQMAGTVAAEFNGAPQKWRFEAFDIDTEGGAALLQEHAERGGIVGVVTDAGGAVVDTTKKGAGLLGRIWGGIPALGKVAAVGTGVYLAYRKWMK